MGPVGVTGATGATGAAGEVENEAGYELMLAEMAFLMDTRIDNVKVGNASGRIVIHQNPMDVFARRNVTLQSDLHG